MQPTQSNINCSSTFTLPYFAYFVIKQYIHNHLPQWPNLPYFGWRIQFLKTLSAKVMRRQTHSAELAAVCQLQLTVQTRTCRTERRHKTNNLTLTLRVNIRPAREFRPTTTAPSVPHDSRKTWVVPQAVTDVFVHTNYQNTGGLEPLYPRWHGAKRLGSGLPVHASNHTPVPQEWKLMNWRATLQRSKYKTNWGSRAVRNLAEH